MLTIGDVMKTTIKELSLTIEELEGLQRADGGWFYYNFVQYSGSFVTASAISAFCSGVPKV